MFGKLGDEPGDFLSPGGIDFLSDGRIAVFDQTRIQICDVGGECRAFGAGGTEVGEFAINGRGLAVDGEDRIVISDTGNWRIQVCDESGNCSAFGRDGEATPNFEDVGTFFYPSSVDLDRSGRIWVGSDAYHRVQICDIDGQCTAFGEPYQICSEMGCEESSFYQESTFGPGSHYVHVDEYDRVFISRPHSDLHNILVCDQSEIPRCAEFGPRGGGEGAGEFNYPGPMDSDEEGLLFVVDWANHRIQNCNVNTGRCKVAGYRGDGPGQFLQLVDLSIREGGLLASMEFENRRVQLFTIDRSNEFAINTGLNDAWFNAATDGQGFFITVYPDHGSLFLSWFTFETEERDESAPPAKVGDRYHRWLTAYGAYEGNAAQLDIQMTSGGLFLDPEEVNGTEPGEYGSLSIEFHDCWTATVQYDLHALGLAGEIPITRIASDIGRACEIMDFK